jgi:pilus assembly protein CpaB
MRRRLFTVILFAVVAALVSSTLLYKVISASTQHPAGAMTQVLVAVRDLDAGALIGETDVRSVEWAATVAPQWIGKREEIVGRGLIAAVNKGEPFPANRLAAKGVGSGLAARIPSGMRAVAVPVDEVTGFSRFILPGMRVDVLSTGTPSDQGGQGPVTRTIIQNIEVLSTGQNPQDKSSAVRAINLLVTPEQAETLSQATAQNKIQLALRNPLDQGSVANQNKPLAPRKVTPVSASKAPAAPVQIKEAEEPKLKPPTVEIIHGMNKVFTVVGATKSAAEAEQKP